MRCQEDVESNTLVPGGGAAEASLSVHLDDYATHRYAGADGHPGVSRRPPRYPEDLGGECRQGRIRIGREVRARQGTAQRGSGR
jgi:hypothetical protein